MLQRLLPLALLATLAASGAASAQTLTRIDINPGSERSGPFGFTRLGDAVYFVADDGVSGSELWRSDGTVAGTRLVKDILPGPNGVFFDGLTEFDGALYFGGNDGTTGEELWRTDGTEAGTVLVKDINPGPPSSNPEAFIEFGGALYFRASDGNEGAGTGIELWRTDGTTAGTVRVKDINPGVPMSFPNDFTVFDGALYFSAATAAEGGEVWRTDGTEAGTMIVTEIDPSASDRDRPRDFVVYDGALLFSAHDGTTGRELWRSDGTPDGTALVRDFRTGGGDNGAGLGFLKPAELNGLLYFGASSRPEGRELWRTDGTTDGTVLVKDITPGTGSGYLVEGIGTSGIGPTLYRGRLLFSASDGASGAELWQSDGTADGTVRVADLNPGSGDSAPYGFTPFASMVYFVANDGTTGREVWVLTDAPVPGEDAPDGPSLALRAFPNPTREVATVTLTLPEAGHVRLSVYDALGREVAVALDGPLGAGRQSVALDTARLPAGVYVVRLTARPEVAVQRLTVVR